MELHRISVPDHFNYNCAEPGGQYYKAQHRFTLGEMKANHEIGGSFDLMFYRWTIGISTALVLAIIALLAQEVPTFAWKGATVIAILVFGLFAALNERFAWRERHRIANFEASGGRTPAEEEALRNPHLAACGTVSNGFGKALDAVWRWNAYVERVKLGTVDRFEDDVHEGREIEERLNAILELDPLVYRLYRDDSQYRWEIEHKPSRAERPSYVSSEMALQRLDLSAAASAEAWLKSLLERRPELVSP